MTRISEALPSKKISSDIFRSYYFLKLDTPNSGIIVEDGCFEFIFLQEKNLFLSTGKGEQIPLPNCFAWGNTPLPYRIVFPDTLNFVAIKLQPWVSAFFVGDRDQPVTDLVQLYGAPVEQLHRQIFQATDLARVVDLLDDFFVQFPLPSPSDYAISKKICALIEERQGVIKVKDIVNQFPHSRQWLNKHFLYQSKISIKHYAVYVRIRQILKYKLNHPEQSLTEVAYEFGYFDQSHFIKDIRKVTGLTPSKFLANENLFLAQLKALG